MNPATEQLLGQYLQQLKAVRDVSDHTIRAYEDDLREFFQYLNKFQQDRLVLDSIRPRWIRKYTGELSTSGLARTSVARKLSSIKGFFRFRKIKDSEAGDPGCVKLFRDIFEKLRQAVLPVFNFHCRVQGSHVGVDKHAYFCL